MLQGEYIMQHLKANRRVGLLYVLQSEGSSPGRQGFSMVVDEEGALFGSIGGGLMEHKLVEVAKAKLNEVATKPFLRRQIHRKDADRDQSGLICSGEQLVAFYFLDAQDGNWVQGLIECQQSKSHGVLQLDEKGIVFKSGELLSDPFICTVKSESAWALREQIGFKNTVYILGGGHVGQALSEIMNNIGFYVEQFDDRADLNTMVNNEFAHRRHVIDYDAIDEHIPEGECTYICVVSFGYRTDKAILKKLIGKRYKYLGMMGSEEKVKRLYAELIAEGISREDLARVHSPIGIPILSKTPMEIAVSIAGQIIKVKNS